ncbi:MAG: HAD-IIB family hydrolase [Bdellovibrionota bacterium]
MKISSNSRKAAQAAGSSPLALEKLSKKVCRSLKGIFADIDDTLTVHGKLPEDSYRALWQLQRAGLRMVPVTGRPAGWVDHLARMWPVDAVIGENGAFYFYLDMKQGRDGKLIQRFVQEKALRETNRKKLWEVFHALSKEMPGLEVASDQGYREIDLAVDFCEDVPRRPEKDIDQIVAAFVKAGAQAKISSIHVNAWFGAHDKYSCCRLLLRELWNEDFDKERENYLYFGDSPNDEPLFREFPNTVGVANVRDFLPRMKHTPRFITKKDGGHGFAEAVKWILKQRG